MNPTGGGELWRSSSGDDGSWVSVVTGGFDDADNWLIVSTTGFSGNLYAGALNDDNGGEIWRSSDGITWTQAISGGFGNADNSRISSLAVFNGYLYAGCFNEATGAQIWRSPDGTDWTPVEDGGFGNVETGGMNALEVFDEQLYFVVGNSTTGVEVWRTGDGVNWEQSGPDGLGDSNNYATYWDNAATVFNDSLYIGASNKADGGEVWRNKSYSVQLPLVLENYSVFVNPYEDCDSFEQAYGPLEPGIDYRAYPDDNDDYYYLVLESSATITVQVIDYQADGQVLVYDESGPPSRDSDYNAPGDPGDTGDGVMIVDSLDLESGKYYVRIYTAPGSQHTDTLYTLTVSY
jgi:hypothetical protein